MTLQKVYNTATSLWEVVDTGAAPTASGYIYSSTTGKLTTGTTAPVSPLTGDIWVDTNSLPENLAPSSIVWKEIPTGLVNGVNTTYTTAQGYVSNTLQLFINGVANSGMTTETSPGSGGFTVTPAPLTGDNLSVQYQVRVTATGNADTVDGYHASVTPTANNLLSLDGNARIAPSALGARFLDSNFTVAATRFSTTAASFVDIPNCNLSYTAGVTNERMMVVATFMCNKGAGVEGAVRLEVDGVQFGPEVYYNPASSTWVRGTINAIVPVLANQTRSFKVRASSGDANIFFVINDVPRWMPKITGVILAE